MARLTDQGWTIEPNEPGGGSRCVRDPDNPRILLDPHLANAPPEAGASTLAHEIGHAMNPVDPMDDPTGAPDRDAYADNEVNKALEDEGHATLKNAQARQEISDNGGSDIGYPGNPDNAAAYDQISQDVQKGTKTPEQGAKEIGEIYRNNEEAGGTGGKTYDQYYRDAYKQIYDNANGPPTP